MGYELDPKIDGMESADNNLNQSAGPHDSEPRMRGVLAATGLAIVAGIGINHMLAHDRWEVKNTRQVIDDYVLPGGVGAIFVLGLATSIEARR